jgi:hypothetical protein
MKKVVVFIVLGILISAFLSCDIESSGNGKLDGNWRIASIDTLATGRMADYSNKLIYWAFQNNLLSLYDTNGEESHILMRFNHTGDTLKLYEPYLYDREKGDIKLEDKTVLKDYGITSLEENFFVEALSGSKMVLRSGTLRIKFKKW